MRSGAVDSAPAHAVVVAVGAAVAMVSRIGFSERLRMRNGRDRRRAVERLMEERDTWIHAGCMRQRSTDRRDFRPAAFGCGPRAIVATAGVAGPGLIRRVFVSCGNRLPIAQDAELGALAGEVGDAIYYCCSDRSGGDVDGRDIALLVYRALVYFPAWARPRGRRICWTALPATSAQLDNQKRRRRAFGTSCSGGELERPTPRNET